MYLCRCVCVFLLSCLVGWSLTAEQAVQRAELLSQRFHVLGGAEPAGDRIAEEAVVSAHGLQEEETRGGRNVWFIEEESLILVDGELNAARWFN